jgi:hypothetical protein
MKQQKKFSASSGIAIGPILFVLAILAIIAMFMASGNENYQTASGADRISTDIISQANLIRSTINQCNLQYQMAISTGSVTTAADAYPFGSALGTVTPVSALLCDPMGTTSLWMDKLLPPPTGGFTVWNYVNGGAAGGRCIWTQPDTATAGSIYYGATPANIAAITSGLANTAKKFNSATGSSTTSEFMYNPAGASQKVVVWITPNTGAVNANCVP